MFKFGEDKAHQSSADIEKKVRIVSHTSGINKVNGRELIGHPSPQRDTPPTKEDEFEHEYDGVLEVPQIVLR